MQKQSRPFLLTGLILSIIAYVAIFVAYFLSIVTLLGLAGQEALVDTAIALVIVMAILVMIFSLLGLIFAAVSISRCKLSPQEFAGKKGLIITTFVFNVIIAVFLLIGLINTFSALTLILLIVMILAAVFIMIDVAKNKKLLEETQNVQSSQVAEAKVEENKEDK